MSLRYLNVSVQLALLVLVGFAPFSVRDAEAGTGQKILLPAPRVVPKHGIRLAVDPHWVEGRGYRPIRIVVTATKASQADRTVSVNLRGNGWTNQPFDISVQQDIELPAGATRAKATIAIPSFEPLFQISMDVLVDDVVALELSGRLQALNQSNGWSSPNPRIVVIGSGTEGINEFAQVVEAFLSYSDMNYMDQLQQFMSQYQQPGVKTSRPTKPSPYLLMSETSALIAGADLPERWIDYSSLDIVYSSLSELRTLKNKHPRTLRAILDWVATGGNLWVSGVGTKYEQLSEIEDACALPTVKVPGAEHPGWQMSESDLEHSWPVNNILSPDYAEQYLGYEEPVRGDLAPGLKPADEQTVTKQEIKAPAHLWRDYSLGRIVALADNRLPDSEGPQRAVKLLDFRRHQWTHRHGLSPSHESGDFWNFLIPGVGLAPVGAFRVLITLFVVVIGPVNFFFLHRWKRINLLILTVPISAGVVTAALFAYALLSDGLGTRERVRSYVELNQRNAELVAWARHSYYAGLTPSAGLEFSKDTVVLPLLNPQNHMHRNQSLDSREIQWHDQQHLTEGWLKARTPTQYVTVRRAKTSTELKISSESGEVKITNQLGARIVELILIDEDGSYHAASNIEPNATITMIPVKKLDAAKMVREKLKEGFPRVPEIMQQRRYGGLFNIDYGSPSDYSGSIGNFDYPGQNTSRLEQALYAIQVAGGPRESRSYIAILEQSPEVFLGLENVEEESSFHVVEGKW